MLRKKIDRTSEKEVLFMLLTVFLLEKFDTVVPFGKYTLKYSI